MCVSINVNIFNCPRNSGIYYNCKKLEQCKRRRLKYENSHIPPYTPVLRFPRLTVWECILKQFFCMIRTYMYNFRKIVSNLHTKICFHLIYCNHLSM